MSNTATPDRLLSVTQAADYLHVSRSTAYRMVREGVIDSVHIEPHVGTRRPLRVPYSEVCRYLSGLKAQAQEWAS